MAYGHCVSICCSFKGDFLLGKVLIKPLAERPTPQGGGGVTLVVPVAAGPYGCTGKLYMWF